MNKELNTLNKKIKTIKMKRHLTENDLVTINRNINNISIGLRDQRINGRTGSVENTLRETVKVVLTTPTRSNKAYKMKKDFLGNTPNIMFINMNDLPNNYLKRFLSKNKLEELVLQSGGNMAEIANIPEQRWLESPKPPTIHPLRPIEGIEGCLGQVNDCKNNGRLVYDAEGIIGCNNPNNQGGQRFIYPQNIQTYN